MGCWQKMGLVAAVVSTGLMAGCGLGTEADTCQAAADHLGQCLQMSVETDTASCDVDSATLLLSLTCEQLTTPPSASEPKADAGTCSLTDLCLDTGVLDEALCESFNDAPCYMQDGKADEAKLGKVKQTIEKIMKRRCERSQGKWKAGSTAASVAAKRCSCPTGLETKQKGTRCARPQQACKPVTPKVPTGQNPAANSVTTKPATNLPFGCRPKPKQPIKKVTCTQGNAFFAGGCRTQF